MFPRSFLQRCDRDPQMVQPQMTPMSQMAAAAFACRRQASLLECNHGWKGWTRMNTDRILHIRVALFVLGFFASCLAVRAASVRIELDAPGYKGERALLYRYLDLFTLRTELIGQARI